MTGTRLTDRERTRILKLRGDGLSIDRIATKVDRNPRTVMDAIHRANEEMDRRDRELEAQEAAAAEEPEEPMNRSLIHAGSTTAMTLTEPSESSFQDYPRSS